MIEDMFDRLSEPFPADAISWRIGSTNADKTQGMALAYLDARDVMDRLDLVCGPAGWQCRYSHVGGITVCEIGLKVDGEWVWKSDGAGATDVEAEKGALSDAFKRGAVRWGIGRYLYALASPWVEIEQKGRSSVIKKEQYQKLRNVLNEYTRSRKSSASSKRDKDYEWFKEKIDAATNMEELGAIGREIKEALPSLPVAARDPLHDAYALKREELAGE